MNITLKSDQAVDVRVILTFYGELYFEFHMRVDSYGPATYCVVGRSPQEVDRMQIIYDGNHFDYPALSTDGVHLDVINIYGGRDHWTQVLRDKAMAS
jgi:peroxiredoxin